MADVDNRAAIFSALYAWIHQRPGLDPGNYDRASYAAEMRQIGRDLRDARTLIRAVELSSVTAAALREAFERAFSGRLSWDGKKLGYCTGQYWPTEYRKAAAAVAARALWAHRAEDYKPGEGLKMRAAFRREFGRGIASRWFN